jgi:beta-glucanase (GH16 family)
MGLLHGEWLLWIVCLFGTALTSSNPILFVPHTTASPPDRAEKAKWTLTWSDEFDQPDGSLPDPKKWKLEVGGNGWGNHELEYYTNRAANASVQKGHLVVEARREQFRGVDGVQRGYTSARLTTQGLFAQAYGKFAARIRIPEGQGMWPAFWLMGSDFAGNNWPQCGEIDVMENIGKEPSAVHGSMHGPGYSEELDFTSTYKKPGGVKISDDFHEFSIEWEPGSVRFFVDDQQYAAFFPSHLPAGKKWVFDHPFFILLNVAVGGDWPGSPDRSTRFPQRMLVDYVRVYQASPEPKH